MTTSWDSKGRPRQLRLIAENSRCSILFHLEVPGGRWQTVMSSPASVAKAASSVFHNRSRVPIRMLRTPDAPWRSARRPATTATPARPNAGGSTTNGQRPDRSPQQAASYHKCGQTKQKNLNNYCAPPNPGQSAGHGSFLRQHQVRRLHAQGAGDRVAVDVAVVYGAVALVADTEVVHGRQADAGRGGACWSVLAAILRLGYRPTRRR